MVYETLKERVTAFRKFILEANIALEKETFTCDASRSIFVFGLLAMNQVLLKEIMKSVVIQLPIDIKKSFSSNVFPEYSEEDNSIHLIDLLLTENLRTDGYRYRGSEFLRIDYFPNEENLKPIDKLRKNLKKICEDFNIAFQGFLYFETNGSSMITVKRIYQSEDPEEIETYSMILQ